MSENKTPHQQTQGISRCQSVSAVLWPSFLAAGAATGIFFTIFDPLEIAACRGIESISRIGVYSVGFFIFWGLTAISSCATQYFLKPCKRPESQR
ncbi:MAG TPA: hypothetical protein ENJ84_12525 [Gammaproteobacteria bacterium]|nr:hypothetical protein [Gammaproteobacteria bacterium]